MEKQRNVGEIITRMTTLAMLSALGFVLMSFAQFPYPLAPWLKIEISEIVTIIAYALYGLPGGLIVAVIKTALNLLVHGPVGLGIGDLTALFTSLVFVFGLFLTSHIFKWFKKGLGFRILAYVVIVAIITVTLTVLNAIFITPSYLTVFGPNAHFSTCFEPGVINNVASYITGQKDIQVNGWSYVGIISGVYAPFNLMKAGACFLIYELVFNRLIFVFMHKSEFFQQYFVGITPKKNSDSIEEEDEEIVDEDNKE